MIEWRKSISFLFKLIFKTRIKIKNLSVWKLISPFLVGFQFLKIMIHLHSHPYSPCQKLTPRTGKGWNQWNNQFTKQTIIWPCGSPSIHVACSAKSLFISPWVWPSGWGIGFRFLGFLNILISFLEGLTILLKIQ